MIRGLYERVLSFLTSYSQNPLKGKHLKRLEKLAHMIVSCVYGKKSSIEGLSNFKENGQENQQESYNAQTKRWLSSKWNDWNDHYRPFITTHLKTLISSDRKELILIIDGTQTAGNCTTLMISALHQGYAIPIAWQVKEMEKGHFKEQTHINLIQKIKEILPIGASVVLLGDGEFDGQQFLSLLNDWNWKYVTRTANNRLIDTGCDEQAPFNMVSTGKSHETIFIENAFNQSNGVYWKSKKHEEPLFLLTNFELGKEACAYYKKRYKIELLFKQLKSYGFNLQDSKIESEKRCDNLILVLSYSFIFTFSIGILLKEEPKEIVDKSNRYDRIKRTLPITMAQKCLAYTPKTAIRLFETFANNLIKFKT